MSEKPTQKNFPVWEQFYAENPVETMHWFNPELDADLSLALVEFGLKSGSVLDIGTGPGTHAIHLAQRGYLVTGTDISATAIKKAKDRSAEEGVEVTWKQDDILETQLDQRFDFIFDCGCFHVLAPHRREVYVSTIKRLLNLGGYLFLKCFSSLQPGEEGPHRFTTEQVQQIFGNQLKFISAKETIYRGQLTPSPRALFCVLKREN